LYLDWLTWLADQREAAVDTDTTVQRTVDAQLLQESLNLVAPVAGELIASFYDQLFTDYPEVRPMFPANMDLQQERLLKAVIALVTHYDQPEALLPALTQMGNNHVKYGVQLDHYAAVGATLLATLRRFAGDAWNAEYEGAWGRAYTFAAGAMMQAGAVTSQAAKFGEPDIEDEQLAA
jgi:methyl-accepting chemotaxis protein